MLDIQKSVASIISELEQAINEYKKIEKDIYNECHKVFAASMSEENNLSPGWRYFHILKQYIYEKFKIPLKERLILGKITYCYGALIEIADDIADDQFVWSVPFSVPFPHRKLNLLTQFWMLSKALEDFYQEYSQRRKWGIRILTNHEITLAKKSIYDHLCKMGAEVIKHENKKGEILRPEILEKGLLNAEGGYHDQMIPVIMETLKVDTPVDISAIKENFRLFGLGIEMLADASDVMEDFENKKHNYFISFVHHQGTQEEKQTLFNLLHRENNQAINPYHVFQVSLRRVRLRAYKLIFRALWPYYGKLTKERKQRIKDLVLFYEPPLSFEEHRHKLKVEFYRQLEERLNR